MANLQLQILLKEKNRLMLNLVPISFLLSCALSAAFPSSIDLAAKFEQGMSHLELPQSFFNKLIRKPVKTIKVFRAPKIFMDDFHVKLSEDFKSFHVDGITSEGYGKATLVTGLEQAHIVIPGDLTKWKYGTSGKLWTSNYVRMKEYTRLSKDESWIWDGKIAEQKIVFSAMRYKGKRLGNGKRENDVFVIEKFLSLDPIYRPVPKPKTVFRKGGISGVTIDETMVIYEDLKTWRIPTISVGNFDCEIRGTEMFINEYVLGNPGEDFSRKYLFVFPASNYLDLLDADLIALKPKQSGTVRTRAADVTSGYALHDGKWTLIDMKPRQLTFDAIKFVNEGSRRPVIVLTGRHG